jgi:hypothetical protein
LAKNIYAVEKDEGRKEEEQNEMREIKRECRDAVAINKLGEENGEETLPFDHSQMRVFLEVRMDGRKRKQFIKLPNTKGLVEIGKWGWRKEYEWRRVAEGRRTA